jgi:hypothetical protein
MPKLQSSNIIGLAGEYLVGAVVAQRLRWPYRMQPIADIGVDGEIEILQETGTSTGRLLKVQAKASEQSDARTRYVKREHFEYWRDLALPVVVAHPLVDEGRVLWSELKQGRHTENLVAFDLTAATELTEASRPRLSELSVEKHHLIDPSLGLIRRLLEDTILHDAVYQEAGRLDYTPPDDLDSPDSLMKYGKLMDRWNLLKAFASLDRGMTERARSELERLGQLVDYTTERVSAVVERRPIRRV